MRKTWTGRSAAPKAGDDAAEQLTRALAEFTPKPPESGAAGGRDEDSGGLTSAEGDLREGLDASCQHSSTQSRRLD